MFLVMEHLAGETLEHRLERGPLQIEQALTIATEIADALTAAHRQGIIHRDLKPANVMLMKTGAKLLDFGVAKLTGHGEQPATAQLASVPTRASLTGEGVIVGTLQYMAPEQLEGKPADARTDVWALGAILYEMVTGKRAFEATTAASLIGCILEREPAPLPTLQPLTPPWLDRLVRQCLAKAPDDRPDTTHDLANELRWMREMTSSAPRKGVEPQKHGRWTALVIAGILAAVVIGATVMRLIGNTTSAGPVARLMVDLHPAENLNAGGNPSAFAPTPGGSRTALAWTPDGRSLVFVGRHGVVQQLYVRPLDGNESRLLPGTAGAQVPAVASDGRWVAFWAGQAIKKVPLAGGPVVEIAADISSPPSGMAWDTSGHLYFGANLGRIWTLEPDGAPKPLTTIAEGELTHVLSSTLPGNRGILYTVRKRVWTWGDEEVVALSPRSGERKVLLRDAADARYVPTGHLVFLRRGVLFAARFDAERLTILGEPVPMLEGVSQALIEGDEGNLTGAGQFAIATTGTLAWVRNAPLTLPQTFLVRVNRGGQISPLPTPSRSYYGMVRVSPDGRQLAATVQSLSEFRIWTADLIRGSLRPFAGDGEAQWPLWTPDGRRMVFSWLKGGQPSVAWQAADGRATPEILIAGDLVPSSWTPDGNHLAVTTLGGGLSVVTVENGRALLQPLPNSTRAERWPEFAPKGDWLAFASNASGQDEVYVQPYPGHGPRMQVSIDGGSSPAWRRDGRELFFVSPRLDNGKRRMMVATFNPASPSGVGVPQVLFEFDPRDLRFACWPARCYDVSTDGQHFYGAQGFAPTPRPVVTHINLVQNWFEELRAKVPVGK